MAHTFGPADGHGAILVTQSVSLQWWGWVIVACVVASPLLGYLWHVGRGDETATSGPGPDTPDARPLPE
jgi:hypothetical protein